MVTFGRDMNACLPWTTIFIPYICLHRRVKSTISRTATYSSFSFTLAFNVNVMKAWLLLATMHMLHLFIFTFQTSIELLSVITQNQHKYVSFSRKEGEKLEGCQYINHVSY